MASRNPYSSIHLRDPRSSSSLFDNYPGGSGKDARSGASSQNSTRQGYGGYGVNGDHGGNGQGSPYMNGTAQPEGNGGGFRPATPNSRGQYSSSVLESLESQNENENTSILSGKVSQLKQLTMAIGDEIRDSSALADKMNDSFDNTRVRLRGTMRRMLRMAERTGVGWKVWSGFFVAVWCLFAWVWLF